MTVVTLRPTSEEPAPSAAPYPPVTGAASIHAALADDSDSSYVGNTAGEFLAGETPPTIPPGAVPISIALRARAARTSSPNNPVVFGLYLDGTGVADLVLYQNVPITWASPTTISIGSAVPISATPASIRAGASMDSKARVYELYVDILYIAAPVVVVNTPTGTVTNTNVPSVGWTGTLDSDGGAQTFYEVKIFTAAQYGAGGFDPATTSPYAASGITAGAAVRWQDTVILPDGDYRAYVRVAQTVNAAAHWSAWAFSAFTINVALPAVPALTVTPDNTTASIELLSTHNAGTATTDAIEVQRSINGGTTWEPVRLSTATDGVIVAIDAVVVDYEAPNGTTVQYRARALHSYTGTYAASDWATGSGAWSSTDWWLKCPEVPALNTAVAVRSLPAEQRTARQGVFQPLGAAMPIVVTDTRTSRTGTIVLKLATVALQGAVDALLDSGATLLLQSPSTDRWGSRYVRLGNQNRQRAVDMQDVNLAFDSIDWTEVASPAGVISAWPPVLPADDLLPSTTLYPS